jgi:ADP-ribosylglycohydrolase
MQAARIRPSTIVVAFQHQVAVAALVTHHDRVAVGAAVLDVAVVRQVMHTTDVAHEVIVQMVMHQAMLFIEEGLGLVLVHGDVSAWSHYGFEPV